MHGMMPLWCGGFSGVTTNGGSSFTATFPFQLDDLVNAPVKELKIEVPGKIVDWGMDHGDMAIVVLNSDGVVSAFDLTSKASTRIASLPGAKKLLVAGAGLDVYALVDSGRTDTLVKIERKTGKQTSLSIAKGTTRLEPDPSTRGIIAVNPAAKTLLRVDEDLRGGKSLAAEMPDGSGEVFLAPSGDGSVMIARTGAKLLIRVGADGSVRRIPLAAPMDVREFRAVGNGFIMAQDGQRLLTLDGEGRIAKSPFDGVKSAFPVRFAQSWDAIKPEDIVGRGWENVLPGGGGQP